MSNAAAPASQALSMALSKILRLQLDWRTMRRAVGGVVPGLAIAVQGVGGCNTLRSDEIFQRCQPMPVVSIAGVGIAERLRALDLTGERRGPFGPGEQAPRMQRQRHCKGL